MEAIRNKVNLVNFVRGVEPREPMDLVEPVRRHVEEMQKYGLKGTFLVQYDAMLVPELRDLLTQLNPKQFEIGGWLEIVQPMVERIGLPWRGRWPWDYHVNVGFPQGYEPEQRRLLVDEFMRLYHEIFRACPKSMGSWMLDCVTLRHLEQRYGISAACICRDQYGNDGYSLWGGYYSHAYYPSVNNMLSPAQTLENQISIPVFRMLGSDPIHQYDAGMECRDGVYTVGECQGVATMEPVYPFTGGDPDWVNWFLAENFGHENVGFSYLQTGQENSFGWLAMQRGMTHQYAQLARLQQEGLLICEKLCESGEWYKHRYSLSAPCSIQFLSDRRGSMRSIWFYSRFYRINLLADGSDFFLRDFHVFNELYEEKYLHGVETSPCAQYDTLPVMDGYKFTQDTVRAGIYFVRVNGEYLRLRADPKIQVAEDRMEIRLETESGELRLTLNETGFYMEAEPSLPFSLSFEFGNMRELAVIGDKNSTLRLTHRDFSYSLRYQGELSIHERLWRLASVHGRVAMEILAP